MRRGLCGGRRRPGRAHRTSRQHQCREQRQRATQFPMGAHPHKLVRMSIRNTTRRWGALAQLLHWVIVALIITQFTLALMADDLPGNMKKLILLSRHKSIGLTILGLALVRLGWRWANPTPAAPATLKP